MLAENVIYTVNGKLFFMDADQLFPDYKKKMKEANIACECVADLDLNMKTVEEDIIKDIPYNEDFIGGEFGLWRCGDRVLFMNKPTAVKHFWKIMTWADYYYLIDENSEGRVLYDVESIRSDWRCLCGGKKAIEYVYNVIIRHKNWADYDERGEMMNPAEEVMDKSNRRDKLSVENRQRRETIMHLINEARNINSAAGPGSRKRTEELLKEAHNNLMYISPFEL